jgi:AraC-like DNA-binding protein
LHFAQLQFCLDLQTVPAQNLEQFLVEDLLKLKVEASSSHPDSVAEFREDYCRHTLNLEIASDGETPIEAKSEIALFGDAALFAMSLEGARIGRFGSALKDGDANASLISVTSGTLEVENAEGRSIITPGTFHIIPHENFSSVRKRGGSQLFGMIVPEQLLKPRLMRFGSNVFGAVRSSSAVSALTGNYVSAAMREADGMAGEAEALVGRQLHSLLGLLLDEHTTNIAGDTAVDLAVLRYGQMLTAIEQHFAEPEFDVEQVSAFAGISRRTANLVFARHGTTISAEINLRRMRHAMSLLRRRPKLAVISVAHACGFMDVSTFHRRFKSHFGFTPGEA